MWLSVIMHLFVVTRSCELKLKGKMLKCTFTNIYIYIYIYIYMCVGCLL